MTRFTDKRALVTGVTSGLGRAIAERLVSMAAFSGIQEYVFATIPLFVLTGDVILRFDGGEVRDTRDLVRRVADAGVGRAVEVIVYRDGAEATLTVTLGLRDEERLTPTRSGAAPSQPQAPVELLGLTLAPVDEQIRAEMGLDMNVMGLVVREVAPGSDAETKGLRAGDLITEAGQQPVASVADLQAQVDAARSAGRRTVLLMVRSGGDPRFVALSVE